MLFLPTYFPDLFKIKSTKEKQLCNLSSSFFVFFKNNALNLNHVIFSLFLFFCIGRFTLESWRPTKLPLLLCKILMVEKNSTTTSFLLSFFHCYHSRWRRTAVPYIHNGSLLPAALLQPLHQSKWTKNPPLALLLFRCHYFCIFGSFSLYAPHFKVGACHKSYFPVQQHTAASYYESPYTTITTTLKAAWGPIEMEITRCSLFP